MRFIDVETNKTVSIWEDGYTRKAYYIHGTTSDKHRWDTYPLTVRALNRIAFAPERDDLPDMLNKLFLSKYCNFNYQWGGGLSYYELGNNSYLNTLVDRAKASVDLVGHIEKNTAAYIDEIVLIGHSHGGNVAIQAADKILSAMPQIKHVYVLTIGTPANNELSPAFSPIPSIFYDLYTKICHKEQIKNPENPQNWKHQTQISHLALWNKEDWVDGAAYILDQINSCYQMMTSNHNYFENDITENVQFDTSNSENDIVHNEAVMSYMQQWQDKLNYLGCCLFLYHRYGRCTFQLSSWDIHIPEIKDFGTYRAHDEMSFLHAASPTHVRDAMPEDRRVSMIPYNADLLRIPGRKLRDLFVEPSAFDRFCNEIDSRISCRVSLKESDVQSVLARCKVYCKNIGYPELNYIEEVRSSLTQTFEYSELYFYINAYKKTDIRSHGFDLAYAGEIEKAIDDGRIKPFPRAWGNKSSGTSEKSEK